VRKQVRLVGQPIELAGRSVFIAYRKGEKVYIVRTGAGIIHAARAMPALKRRNHPLWRELNEQIVELEPKKGKLQALRELASNARKFGRWAEAEQHYAAICALPLNSAEETVNAHLFLAEVQAKQNKDITPTLQSLQQKTADFADATDKEYATYRLAKFYETQGQLDNASTLYASLCNGSSTSTWAAAALHQLAALKEKQGELQTALQLYLRYPQRFPQNERLAMQSYASALNVADALGDIDTAEQVASAISAKAASVQDYNVHLNLAWCCRKHGQSQVAKDSLDKGLDLARSALARTQALGARITIHLHVLRRLADFAEYQQIFAHFAAYSRDMSFELQAAPVEYFQCLYYKAIAFQHTRQISEALDLCRQVLPLVPADAEVRPKFLALLANLRSQWATLAEFQETLESIEQAYPSHPATNLVRLQAVGYLLGTGKYDEALGYLDKILSTSHGSAKLQWVRNTHWRAVYLRGRCLTELGQLAEGRELMAEAARRLPEVELME
jgi:tetratricopeptide (TPR) repeat protein